MASRKLKPYFQAHPIKVLTSQPIKKVLESKNHSSRMTDWSDQLADFGIEFEPRKAIKAQALADFIAECAHRPTPTDTSAPWALYVDGSSSKAGSGAGLVIISPEGEKFEYAVKFAFHASNNEAEYVALILGLNLCKFMKIKSIQVCSDSQLIVGQMTKEFEVKEENMKAYFEKAESLARSFDNFEIRHIPRSQNQQADALARLASSAEGITPRNIMWEVLEKPSTQKPVIMDIDRGETWMDQIIQCLKGELPEDTPDFKMIKKRSQWFVLHDGILYKQSFTHPLLKCITPEEGNYVLREIHEGACGRHQGGRTIVGKALRAGFYWPTLRDDAARIVKKCEKCQRFAYKNRY
ncbi:uncharacterized protein LOC110708917 [Chenopodium quinoa]|uniref:uncharacterized protein LOC110708917 n=1 Tax=Chenopodium quinoa TaxID=63459 RepID=UPI000B7914AA|nr:uncharacterized protein LOC110708917 [Chenopodium quinoa]